MVGDNTQHGMVDSDFTESTEIFQTSPALAVSFEHFQPQPATGMVNTAGINVGKTTMNRKRW